MTIDAKLNERLRKIEDKHDQMRCNGVVYKVGADGLIRSRPRLVRANVPLRALMGVVGLVILTTSMAVTLGDALKPLFS